jgi:ADP-heptose:LPS heptosyltransferase
VIEASAAYLGSDSGLMHLAATTTTPTVIVFGPTDPRVAAPRTRGMQVLWSPVGASACVDDATGRQRPCAATCCITRVGVPAVAAALARALGAPQPGMALAAPG